MKIFPVDYSLVVANLNPDSFGYVRVTTIGEFKNHIYVWDDGWRLIGADDNSVSWNDIPDKPTSYNPISHTHTVAEIEDLPDLSLKVDKVAGKELSENDFTNELKDKLVSLGGSASVDYNEMAERLNAHEENLVVHVTQSDHDAIGLIGGKADKSYVDTELAKKADSSTLSGHTGSSTIHVTQSDKDKWNGIGDGGDSTETVRQINSLYHQNTSQDREIAYLKLQQDASARIENGTVFAHDMNGNLIGMTLDEVNSQNITIRNGKMLMINQTFSTQTRTDTTAVASAYETSGNGGRKVVRLSNGWFVVGVKTTDFIYLYVDKNDGSGFSQLCYANASTFDNNDFTIASKGNFVYLIYALTTSLIKIHFDATTITNINVHATLASNLDTGQTALGNVSLRINEAKTEFHATLDSTNSTYPNSKNIRYAKGVISQVDGSVTWGAVEQRTTINVAGQDYKNSSITLDGNGNPKILVEHDEGTTFRIASINYNGSAWTIVAVFSGGTYIQSSPSAIFVPQSVNGLANGLLATAWHGFDATHTTTNYVRFSKSTDGGVTWSAMQKLIAGQNASITADSNGNLYIEYERGGSTYFIKSTNNGDSWGTETLKGVGVNPSTILDLNMNISKPLSIRKGASSVVFNGEWSEPVETPTLTAKAVYDLPSTDYVGAFVKKAGTVNVDAYVNDVLMTEELDVDEFMFTKTLATIAPVKLRLELSRGVTTGGESDAVTRILGGIA